MSKKKPRLLLDVDGVLCDFVFGVRQIIHDVGGPKLSNEDFPEWDIFPYIEKLCPKFPGMKETVINAIKTEGFCGSLPVFPGAQAGVKKIIDAGVDLFIVTSPWPFHRFWHHERNVWLANKFDIPEKRIIHTNSKHVIKGDILIDDKSDHIESWLDHNDGAAFLWNTPHNQKDKVPKKQRLSSWEELHDILRIK